MLIPVFINGTLHHLQSEISILEACRIVGITVPRFCYHENLSIAGNCRMCLVEVQDVAKPVVACSTDIVENMIIYTETPQVLKARENVLEFLLLNHPLDCPICDQAGECDLQDQAIFFGSNFSRNYFAKRSVEDKNLNHLIKTIMVRCIHCTKCVRFGEEICGIKFFGTLNRGTNTEIGNYLIKLSLSEISANVIDLCPVGALTLKTIPFQIRPWEIQLIESIDLSDSFGSNIYLSYRGVDIFRVTPKKNKQINDSWVSNKGRFYFELMVKKTITAQQEFPSFFSKQFRSNILFLLNPDLDLKTLNTLKLFSFRGNGIRARFLNSSSQTTNISFWNSKLSISYLKTHLSYTFFLVATNLQVEMPLLNIRVKAHVHRGCQAFAFGGSNATFLSQVLRFSIFDLIAVLRGTHSLFSKFFFSTECLFFFNRATLARVDSQILHCFSQNNIKYYMAPGYCNSEGANLLSFKAFNYKELLYSKVVFGLGLDDTFLIRNLIAKTSNFFWVNQFPSSLLSLLPINSWVNLEINQLPGLYVNMEQRVQQFSLLQKEYKFSALTFISFLASFFSLPRFKVSSFFLSFYFNTFFFNLNAQKEALYTLRFFDNKKFLFLFFEQTRLIVPSFKIRYKQLPIKLILEDPYRTSLQLKYSRALVKSSQLIRMEASFDKCI